jgi:hypothetical protein
MGEIYESGHFMAGNPNASSSGSANSIQSLKSTFYRGANLGTIASSTIDSFITEHGIAAGTFDNLFIGDFFTATYSNNTTIFRVMDIDPYYDISDSGIAGTHHILIVPDTELTTVSNTNNKSSDGYTNSYVHKTAIPTINTKLKAIFGSHYLSYKEKLCTSSMNSTFALVSVNSVSMDEVEIFGKAVNQNTDYGLLRYQLPAFMYNRDLIKSYSYTTHNGTMYWTRGRYSSNFCVVSAGTADNGYSYYSTTSTYDIGVRPRFLLG